VKGANMILASVSLVIAVPKIKFIFRDWWDSYRKTYCCTHFIGFSYNYLL